MSNEFQTFADIAAKWPSISAFAADVGAPTDRARKWIARESIPAEWFTSVTAAARKRGIEQVTGDLLAQIASKNLSSGGNAA